MLRTRAFFPLLYGVATLTCNNFERTSGLPEFLLVIFSRLLVGKSEVRWLIQHNKKETDELTVEITSTCSGLRERCSVFQ